MLIDCPHCQQPMQATATKCVWCKWTVAVAAPSPFAPATEPSPVRGPVAAAITLSGFASPVPGFFALAQQREQPGRDALGAERPDVAGAPTTDHVAFLLRPARRLRGPVWAGIGRVWAVDFIRACRTLASDPSPKFDQPGVLLDHDPVQ